MKTIKQILVSIGMLSMLSAATGQTTNIILQTDFDGGAGEGNYNNNYRYSYAGSSAGGVNVGYDGGITEGMGVGGTFANWVSPWYSLMPTDANWYSPSLAYVYAGVGCGTLFGGPMTPITPTAVTSSFILSADVKVTGLLPGVTTVNVYLPKVQFMSGAAVIFDFTGDVGQVGSDFVHIALPLSSLSYGGENGAATHPVSDLTNAAVVGSIDGFTIAFSVKDQFVGTIGGDPLISPPFGFTDTGTLVVDNIQLIQTGNTVPTPIQEKLIAQINFDDHPAVTNTAYSFSDVGSIPTVAVVGNTGVGGSKGLQTTADCTAWATTPPTSYSGWGANSLALTPYTLTSSSKSSYRLYVTAKAGGFLSGVTSGSGALSLQFMVPDGTIGAPDGNADVVFELQPSVTLTSDFQTFVFDGSSMASVPYNGGSQALFNQYISQVSAVGVLAQAAGDTGATPAVWGYDANNTVTVDNLKVVELVAGLPDVSVVSSNNEVKVYWSDPVTGGAAQLQSSTNAAGPYLDVSGAASGAASPYTVPAGTAQAFFRTIWVP
jgi:hypothetical protein